MTKTYTLKGLDCPNCAAKIEGEVKALKGVSHASVNVMASTLRLEVDGGHAGGVTRLVEGIVRAHEPGVAVIDREARAGTGDATGEKPAGTLKLAAGAAVFCAGLLMEHAFNAGIYAAPALFVLSYLVLGGEVVLRALKNIARGRMFDENFLMSVATVGAFIIGDFPEAAAVMLFYQIGEYFQDMAVRRSRKSIAGLMDIRPDYAHLMRDGALVTVAPEAVSVGDVIMVKPGERIPLDGVVIEGESALDTVALTGESAPRNAAAGDAVLSGCVNINGALTIEVTKPFAESTASKIIALVEDAGERKAPAEHFITTFSRYYTPAVVGLAALIAVLPPLFFGAPWADWVSRGLIFLVISCPCALVISIPLGYFGGIGAASRKGVLVKGGNYLEALGNLDIVVFDKTGTLTKGVFKVTNLLPAAGFTQEHLLEAAARAEALSNHPVAVSILKAYGREMDKTGLTEYKEFAGRGVSVKAGGSLYLAGDGKLMAQEGVGYEAPPDTGTKVYVGVDGVFIGCIVIADEIKPDSAAAVAALKARGVRRTALLTGDSQELADTVARELRLDEAHGGLLPGRKVELVEAMGARLRAKGKLAFVGDGINDAPVLARADVGVAMGGLGSDAAIEAADVVLMTDEPSRLAEAIDVAKATKRVVWQNIVFALGIKGVILLLGALGAATMWAAVFADVGVAMLAVLNAARVMRMK